ncbi:MAG: 4-hydroxybenzoate 3-monooxygenase [Janthinobacterium lividum]
MKTQVAIVGAGPAGLLLGHALRQAGIACVVVERTSRARVESRIRAGILETTMTDLLARLGLDARLKVEGMLHEGLTLVSDGEVIPVDIVGSTGKHVTAYGQTEITRDLIDAAPAAGLDIVWEAGEVALRDVDSDHPSLGFTVDGVAQSIECDVIAGCDGFHGPSRAAVGGTHFERAYPFGWLGVLADVAPCHHEVVYASHDRGFALASMRSPTRSRYYVQVGNDERVEDWSDDRFWDELETRLGADIARGVTRGPSIEKSIAPLRSFVSEPMRRGRLFLAGDAAHIVPPTGAKGLNLAASDVIYLSEALIGWFARGDTAGVDGYSARALRRIWKTERFSWYLTTLMHRFPDAGPFERRMQHAELDYIATSAAAQASIAENYVGLPL